MELADSNRIPLFGGLLKSWVLEEGVSNELWVDCSTWPDRYLPNWTPEDKGEVLKIMREAFKDSQQ